jgi:hypothetical protein
MAYPFDPNFLPNNLLHFPSPVTELVACPVGLDLWLKYRAAHPDGPTVPPECPEDLSQPGAGAGRVLQSRQLMRRLQ